MCYFSSHTVFTLPKHFLVLISPVNLLLKLIQSPLFSQSMHITISYECANPSLIYNRVSGANVKENGTKHIKPNILRYCIIINIISNLRETANNVFFSPKGFLQIIFPFAHILMLDGPFLWGFFWALTSDTRHLNLI